MAVTDYQLLLDDLVRDEGGVLSADARFRALQAAVTRFGVDRPRLVVVDVVFADGVSAPVPPQWTPEAVLLEGEHPPGTAPRQPVALAESFDGTAWRLVLAQPLQPGAVVRVRFGAAHVVDGTQDTVPVVHQLPVAQFAAHLLCQQLATYYSAQRETTIGADGSRTESRAREFAARAAELRAAYFAGVGAKDPMKAVDVAGADGAAAAVASWPRRNPRYALTGTAE